MKVEVAECEVCDNLVSTHCSRDKIRWFGDTLCCSEQCRETAAENAAFIAQDENSKARREATGAKW